MLYLGTEFEHKVKVATIVIERKFVAIFSRNVNGDPVAVIGALGYNSGHRGELLIEDVTVNYDSVESNQGIIAISNTHESHTFNVTSAPFVVSVGDDYSEMMEDERIEFRRYVEFRIGLPSNCIVTELP